MAVTLPTETTEYRVLVIDPESRKVCALETKCEYRLIRVAVKHRTRIARELQKTLRDALGLAVVILDILTTEKEMSPCAVVELLNRQLPADFRMIQPQQLPRVELSEQEHASLLAMLSGQTQVPFRAVGWIDEAIHWVEAATGMRVSSKSHVEQYNAGEGFILVRLGMEDGCDYWLKATGAPNTHERPVTSLLSRFCRGYVPEVVAERPAWNAWLMCNEGMSALPDQTACVSQLLEVAAEALAELQMRTVGAELELLEAGARDHRACVLRGEAGALFDFIAEAMDLQTSTKVERVGPKRLRELRNIFEDVCSYIEMLGLPDTVLHGDMNIGNILFGQGRCVFIDWCEAYIGNPLVSLEHLLLLNQRADPALKSSSDQRLRESYRTALSRSFDSTTVDAAFACMPMLAAASAIFGPGEWLRTPARNDARRQAYVRGIARHMDRAARKPALLTALSGSTKSAERFHHATCS